MKQKGCDCKCILVGRKFIDENGIVDRTKLAVIFERWYKEQLSINIEQRHAYTVIKSYAENLCKCECHKMQTIKNED